MEVETGPCSEEKKVGNKKMSGRRRRLKAKCYFEENMMYLPHLKQAFERVDEKFGKTDENGKVSPKSNNPLAAKMNLNNKAPINNSG